MVKVTIEDIVRATGLSRGTVSRALNDKPDISSQTRQLVLDTCRRLNYVPSRTARSLATGRNYAIAVVLDDLRSAFAIAVLRGVLARAQREHYAVQVAELGDEPGATADRLHALGADRIDGALIAAPLGSSAVRAVRDALNVRAVASCWPLGDISCDVLTPDQAESGRLVARYLLRDGSGDILYVYAPGSAAAGERLEGFREIARTHGLDVDGIIVRLPTDTEPGPARFAPVLPHLERARAIAAGDDFLAVDLMLLCLQSGRVPGRDVAILGQGNELVGARISPSLSTVDFSGEEIGRRAAETLFQRVDETRADAPQIVRVAPQLVRRESA
jgi:LacI family transcriptional regulator